MHSVLCCICGNKAQTRPSPSLNCILFEGQMMSRTNLDTCGISCISFTICASFIRVFFKGRLKCEASKCGHLDYSEV